MDGHTLAPTPESTDTYRSQAESRTQLARNQSTEVLQMSTSTAATAYIERVSPSCVAAGPRQQRALLLFFVLVLASAGAAALLVALFPTILPTTLILVLASWLPNIVGVLVTARTDGRAGLRQLFGRVVRWRFSWRWYAVALLLPAAAALLAVGGGALLGMASPRFVTDANVLVPLLLINIVAGPLGEELGWRGTALPRLLARWGALSASLVLGVAWWTFHTPGFLLGLFPAGFTPLAALLGALALTVLITWMFNNTGGSLIPGSLMHLSINFVTAATGVSESPPLYAATVGGLVVAAVIVVVVCGRSRLAKRDAER
jgi:membrane protease YdiL (CAAX protease family)